MVEVKHRKIETNGISLHIAEAGEGPLVILCHGFPELWYSWRHQIPALAEAGYHVVAPDMRGYGGSDAPESVEAYSIFQLTGDMTGLVTALGCDEAVIVGHDWGSIVAWQTALFRPDMIRGVVGMSVPYTPRMPVRPTDLFRMISGDKFFYILYFQDEGIAENELEADVDRSMRMVMYTISGSLSEGNALRTDLPAEGTGFLTGMYMPETLPSWLSEEDLAYYVDQFSQTGFRGGINWYRNFDRNWELTSPWAGAKITVPAVFMAGDRDPVVSGLFGGDGGGNMLGALDSFVPDLRSKVFIEGAGHWNQQEAPEETTQALLTFLQDLD